MGGAQIFKKLEKKHNFTAHKQFNSSLATITCTNPSQNNQHHDTIIYQPSTQSYDLNSQKPILRGSLSFITCINITSTNFRTNSQPNTNFRTNSQPNTNFRTNSKPNRMFFLRQQIKQKVFSSQTANQTEGFFSSQTANQTEGFSQTANQTKGNFPLSISVSRSSPFVFVFFPSLLFLHAFLFSLF